MLSMPGLSTARRFSSSCFSALIRADQMGLVFSWSNHSSSSDMVSNSNFFVDMEPPRSHFFRRALIFRQSDTNQAGNEGTLHRKMMERHYKGILAGRTINAAILPAHRQLAARA